MAQKRFYSTNPKRMGCKPNRMGFRLSFLDFSDGRAKGRDQALEMGGLRRRFREGFMDKTPADAKGIGNLADGPAFGAECLELAGID